MFCSRSFSLQKVWKPQSVNLPWSPIYTGYNNMSWRKWEIFWCCLRAVWTTPFTIICPIVCVLRFARCSVSCVNAALVLSFYICCFFIFCLIVTRHLLPVGNTPCPCIYVTVSSLQTSHVDANMVWVDSCFVNGDVRAKNGHWNVICVTTIKHCRWWRTHHQNNAGSLVAETQLVSGELFLSMCVCVCVWDCVCLCICMCVRLWERVLCVSQHMSIRVCVCVCCTQDATDSVLFHQMRVHGARRKLGDSTEQDFPSCILLNRVVPLYSDMLNPNAHLINVLYKLISHLRNSNLLNLKFS